MRGRSSKLKWGAISKKLLVLGNEAAQCQTDGGVGFVVQKNSKNDPNIIQNGRGKRHRDKQKQGERRMVSQVINGVKCSEIPETLA